MRRNVSLDKALCAKQALLPVTRLVKGGELRIVAVVSRPKPFGDPADLA